MIPEIALVFLSLAAAPDATPANLAGDFDGDGTSEQAAAAVRRGSVRLEIRQDASGRVLAHADAPLPKGGGAPESASIDLSAGSLGSSGSLIAVTASSGDLECRTIWRYREGALSPVPIVGAKGPLPECGPRAGWRWTWERPDPEAPAQYRRERTREIPDGTHRQVESFRYAGFQMDLDPARTSAEIRGIPIPVWFPAEIYSRNALEGLYARYDLSGLKKAPRLRILNDPEAGVFSVRIRSAAGEKTLPVTATAPGELKTQVVLTLGSGEAPPRLLVNLPGRRRGSVNEASLKGFAPGVDGYYTPATQFVDETIHLYSSAEEELAAGYFAGDWSSERGERVSISFASASPLLVAFGDARYTVDVEGAPDGIDAILTPDGRGAPSSGIVLKGPNAFEQFPVRCEGAPAAGGCRKDGPGRVLRRVGGRINAR